MATMEAGQHGVNEDNPDNRHDGGKKRKRNPGDWARKRMKDAKASGM